MSYLYHQHLAQTASTQKWALAQAAVQKTDNWYLYTADFQTAGVGRNAGSSWFAPAGACILATYSKVFSAPDVQLPPALALIAALAVVKMLAQFSISAKIKWPNDVLVAGKKIAGLLPDVQTLGHNLQKILLLGVGLNVNLKHTECQQVGNNITSMHCASGQQYALDAVQKILSEEMTAHIDAFLEAGMAGFLPRLSAVLERYDGKEIKFSSALAPAEPLLAQVVDVDINGALLLQIDGQVIPYFSGKIVSN